MFTGLIEKTGTITSVQRLATDDDSPWTLIVDPGEDFEREHGASIAVNGVCLTEIGQQRQGLLTFHVSPETLCKSSLGSLQAGQLVNLERAMRPTDRLGGHIVLGHVDTTGTVTTIRSEKQFYYVEILIPEALAKYVVTKGSITIDGISLTVNSIVDGDHGTTLAFMLIPVTWKTTRFHQIKINDVVNIEVDMIAKHLERLSLPWKP